MKADRILAIAILVLGAAGMLRAAPRELAINGDFKTVTNGAPAGWQVNPGYPGKLSLLDGGGIRFAVAEGGLAEDNFKGAGILGGERISVEGGVRRYSVRARVKGQGKLALGMAEMAKGAGFLQTQVIGTALLTDAWQNLSFEYCPEPAIGFGRPCFIVYGPGAELCAAMLSVTADSQRELFGIGAAGAVNGSVPAGWKFSNGIGSITQVSDPQEGAVIRASVTAPGLQDILGMGGKVPVITGAKYRVRLRAKRVSGPVSFFAGQCGRGEGFIESRPLAGIPTEWQDVECVYQPTDPQIGYISLAFSMVGDSVILVKRVSVIFDEAENPGVSLDRPAAKRALTVAIQARDATGKLFVNGKETALSRDHATVEIAEGITVLAVEAQATGPNPGLNMALPGSPEADGRWLCATGAVAGWQGGGFDDARWQTPTNSDGWLWSAAGAAHGLFRQVILWNEAFNGPNLCLYPRVKDRWNFPRGGLELMSFGLEFPDLARATSFTFRLDVPHPLALWDPIVKGAPNRSFHFQPSSVQAGEIVRDGKKYHRYVLSYPSSVIGTKSLTLTMLGLKQEGDLSGPACDLYYSRLANGNRTELEQKIPVRVLPAIRGVAPKQIIIQRYYPFYAECAPMNRDMLAAHTKTVLSMGQNFVSLGAPMEHEHAFIVQGVNWMYELLAGAPVRFFFNGGAGLNYGRNLYSDLKAHPRVDPAKELFPEIVCWMMDTPGALGRYYKQKAGEDGKYFYCNQFVIDQPESYQAAVAKELRRNLATFPRTDTIFLDWEPANWGHKSCFCDRCKEAFRKRAGIPQSVSLADDAVILERYARQWGEFRDWQDGRILAAYHAVTRKLGLKLMYYTGERGIEKECAESMDIFFDPSPEGPLDENNFAKYDGWTEDARNRYRPRHVPIVGQFIWGGVRDPWINTPDGYYHPEQWKNALLRAILIYRGGMDVDVPFNMPAGSLYYQGEATRILAAFEDLFVDGERADALAESADLKPANRIVLRRGNERLVLLFNDGDKPVAATVKNTALNAGQHGKIFDGEEVADPAQVRVTIPSQDVVILHIM